MKKNVYSFNTPSSRLHEQSENPSRNGFMGRRALLKVAAGLGVVGVGAGTLLGGASWMRKASAAYFLYDGNAAAAWADKYAISSGTDYSQQTQGGDFEQWLVFSGGDDCTNFASNSMFHGSFPMDSQWFSRVVTTTRYERGVAVPVRTWEYGVSGYHPWTVAPDLYNYLTNKTGYGVLVNTFQGPQKNKMSTNGLVAGDIIFYSWNGDGQINHTAIMTTPGRDSNNKLFDRVDEHTSDRKQIFWSLEDFWDSSLDRAKVTMYCVHINTNTALLPAG